MGAVFVRQYDAPPICHKEILRYAGVRGEASELEVLLKECLRDVEGELSYSVCYAEFAIKEEKDFLDLGFVTTESRALRKNLSGCGSLVVFAATVGLSLDRLIVRYSKTSPSKALMLQAIGAERIEALCNLFCEEFAAELAEYGKTLRPRFSPGYGDFPLTVQRDIFAVLDCPRKIGVSLNESLLMSPSKSVTALMGIGRSII